MLSRHTIRTTRRASVEAGACVVLTLAMAGGVFLLWHQKNKEAEQQIPARAVNNSATPTYTTGSLFERSDIGRTSSEKVPDFSPLGSSDSSRSATSSRTATSFAKPAALPPGPTRTFPAVSPTSSGTFKPDSKTLLASYTPPPPAVKSFARPGSGTMTPGQFGFKAPNDPTKPKKGDCGCGKKK
jgi:hypothetical protein